MENKYRYLAKKRIENRFTYDDMAHILNISKPYYWQLENKKRNLSYKMAINIANVFKLKPDELFYNEEKQG
ncbi:MAG: helix-turn-helix transcriptional regulator [Bacilli bacterium]